MEDDAIVILVELVVKLMEEAECDVSPQSVIN
jgi:hypothetical protein